MLIYICIGLAFNMIGSLIGITTGHDAVEYYKEIHQTFENQLIHSIFMIPTTYSVMVWVPALFNMSLTLCNEFHKCIFLFYTTHYCMIHIPTGLLTAIMYYYPFHKAYTTYLVRDRYYCIKYGLFVMCASLFIQEYVGHYIYEHKQSRPDGIINALLYATYTGVNNIFVWSK